MNRIQKQEYIEHILSLVKNSDIVHRNSKLYETKGSGIWLIIPKSHLSSKDTNINNKDTIEYIDLYLTFEQCKDISIIRSQLPYVYDPYKNLFVCIMFKHKNLSLSYEYCINVNKIDIQSYIGTPVSKL